MPLSANSFVGKPVGLLQTSRHLCINPIDTENVQLYHVLGPIIYSLIGHTRILFKSMQPDPRVKYSLGPYISLINCGLFNLCDRTDQPIGKT